MFSELPKLFDRNFTIGYVVPVALFVAALLLMLRIFHLDDMLVALTYDDPLIDTAYIILGIWFGGIILLSLNYQILQFLEGYGRWNPLQLMIEDKKRNFERLGKRLDELDRKNASKCITRNEKTERSTLSRLLTNGYPNLASSVLPTTIGNVIKAFEKYPKVMYGIEATHGWDRLQAVIPKDYSQLILDEKTKTDFWVNTWLLSSLFIGIYGALALQIRFLPSPLLLGSAVFFGYFACRQATSAAESWGHMVKSAFDVYLPSLAEKLGFELPESRDEQWKMWDDFSQAIIYRDKTVLPKPTGDKKQQHKVPFE